ncbi:MAG TPA: sugar ABC transporter permease [Clostridiaceae bacterium]|nr:sugar ABC transporter permease [Clostridiaceae bacterium]
MPKKGLTLQQKRAWSGIIFILPFLIGFVLFFAYPMILSAIFSFSRMTIHTTGYELSRVGIKNYRDAFLVDPTFNRELVESVGNMLMDVPLVIFFSFFSSVLLNQKFRGRTLARVIFFLPVVMSSGIIATMESTDYLRNYVMTLGVINQNVETSTVLGSFRLSHYLLEIGLHPTMVNYITSAVNRINDIVSMSGVQILVFLSALQTIPPSLFEASNIEGATGWENFWKITFPMLSPYILTCVVYTVIDYFMSPKNVVMETIRTTAFVLANFTYSAALAWIYFIVVSILLLIIVRIISKRVFYYE